MTAFRCGHFRMDVEEVAIPLVPVALRVPVRRCLLAERMVILIASSEGGMDIARKLVVSSTGDVDGTFVSDSVRAAFGPDLEAIHAADCTSDRCRESCVPGFRLLLEQFGYAELAAQQQVDDCVGAALETQSP